MFPEYFMYDQCNYLDFHGTRSNLCSIHKRYNINMIGGLLGKKKVQVIIKIRFLFEPYITTS